jgi:hypothetical protein
MMRERFDCMPAYLIESVAELRAVPLGDRSHLSRKVSTRWK